MIRVEDSGIGIDPRFLPHVFEEFRQADGPGIGKGGLGLGLAISRHIVELHGGRIQAASAGLGRGATFTVRIPVEQRDEKRGGSRYRIAATSHRVPDAVNRIQLFPKDPSQFRIASSSSPSGIKSPHRRVSMNHLGRLRLEEIAVEPLDYNLVLRGPDGSDAGEEADRRDENCSGEHGYRGGNDSAAGAFFSSTANGRQPGRAGARYERRAPDISLPARRLRARVGGGGQPVRPPPAR